MQSFCLLLSYTAIATEARVYDSWRRRTALLIAIEADGKHESNKQKLYSTQLRSLEFLRTSNEERQVLEIDIIACVVGNGGYVAVRISLFT